MNICDQDWTAAKIPGNHGFMIADGAGELVAFVPGNETTDALVLARAIAHLPEIIQAAEEVIADWESGNLASAVHQLEIWVKSAQEVSR